jgi:hypothetical protein
LVILPAEANVGEVRNTFLNIFKNLGIPLSARKTEGPSHVIEYLGIYLDTVKMEARLPREKIVRIQAVIEVFTGKCSISHF